MQEFEPLNNTTEKINEPEYIQQARENLINGLTVPLSLQTGQMDMGSIISNINLKMFLRLLRGKNERV